MLARWLGCLADGSANQKVWCYEGFRGIAPPALGSAPAAR